MKKDIIEEAKAGWRAPEARLDVGAIMAAVRAEAAERPARRAPRWVAPEWLGGLAAGLAVLATGGMLTKTAAATELQVNGAWAAGGEATELAETASLW